MIFILGNGPSLNTQRELMPMVGQYDTFCCNRMVQWDGLCFVPTYYACNYNIVRLGIEPINPPYKQAKFIISLNGETLLGWSPFTKDPNAPLLMHGEPLSSGGTMPYLMAQIAVRLGYRELYFLGIEQGGEGYCFGLKDKPYRRRNYEKLFARWKELKDFCESDGVHLTDCTPDGQLNKILGYIPLEKVLA